MSFEQLNSQWINLSKRFADTAIRAHGLAVEGFEKSLNVNLKTIENRVEATVGFVTEATAARDFEAVKTLWPKGLNLAKESAELLAAAGQELVALTLKTGESLGALYANDVDAATNTFQTQVDSVGAKVRKTAR